MKVFGMSGWPARTVISLSTAAILLWSCSDSHPAPIGPVPTGPVSTAHAGKAAFNESKAIEKIYHAGYTNISLTMRGGDGVWRGHAVRRGSGAPVAVSVAEDGPVVAR